MGFDYCEPDDRPSQNPGVRNPFTRAGDAELPSELGVAVGHVARLARSGLTPDDGGVYRGKAPSMNPKRAKWQTANPGRQIRK